MVDINIFVAALFLPSLISALAIPILARLLSAKLPNFSKMLLALV